jgi:hypothetical protein
MDGPRHLRTLAALRPLGLALPLAVLCGACAARQEARALPPQAVTQQTLEPPPPSELPVPAAVKDDGKTIVIDEGGERAAGEISIVEAARAEKLRRQTAGPPIAVINNKNLPEHATGTLSTGSVPAKPVDTSSSPDTVAAREEYWRSKVREARQAWHDAEVEIAGREAEVAEFRKRFYAEDDPFRRDEQIKPAWDHALELLAASKRRSRESGEAVGAILEEGRRAGALPGWLREGFDLEPQPRAAPSTTHEPGEPTVVGEGDTP